jgi:hypothetical protein
MFGAVLLLLALSLSLSLVPVSAQADAQASDWSLYLIDSMTQQVLRIYLDGRQETYDLGMPAGTYLGRSSADFTPDGNRVAYCINDSPDSPNMSLFVRDMGAGQVFTVSFGQTAGRWVDYSNDGSQIAVSLARHYAGDPNADPNTPTWQLLVLDATNGTQLYEMNPIKGAAYFDVGRALMPDVRYFAGNLIVFAGLAWGTEGFPTPPAYLWQTTDDAIQPVERWWRWGWDALAYTGELAWVEVNANLPAAEPGGPMPQGNVVKLANDGGQESTIYANPDWIIMGTKFIDAGRQLAINELQGFDENNMEAPQGTRWIALNRDGTSSELVAPPGYSELVAAPDGFALLWASDNSATPLMTLDYHTGRETTTLWQTQQQMGTSWQLLWSAPTRPAQGLTPFQSISVP